MLSADWFRKFTLRERLQILFGFNLIVLIRIPTQHHPGQFKPVVAGHTTKLLKPDDAMLEKMKAVLDGETLHNYQGIA
jgi:hypothetical protein